MESTQVNPSMGERLKKHWKGLVSGIAVLAFAGATWGGIEYIRDQNEENANNDVKSALTAQNFYPSNQIRVEGGGDTLHVFDPSDKSCGREVVYKIDPNDEDIEGEITLGGTEHFEGKRDYAGNIIASLREPIPSVNAFDPTVRDSIIQEADLLCD